MDEMRKTRAKVRERERAIWNRVETVGREARTADATSLKVSAAVSTEPNRDKQAQTLSSGS